jgi:hypothetical protein
VASLTWPRGGADRSFRIDPESLDRQVQKARGTARDHRASAGGRNAASSLTDGKGSDGQHLRESGAAYPGLLPGHRAPFPCRLSWYEDELPAGCHRVLARLQHRGGIVSQLLPARQGRALSAVLFRDVRRRRFRPMATRGRSFARARSTEKAHINAHPLAYDGIGESSRCRLVARTEGHSEGQIGASGRLSRLAAANAC